MTERTQPIRRSQFIFTYGPGSLLEGVGGSRIIPRIDKGLDNFGNEFLQGYQIDDSRMELAIKNFTNASENIRIFMLPSNASLNKPPARPLYLTSPFPLWKICYSNSHNDPILYNSCAAKNCPSCKGNSGSQIRFIIACGSGHMDEVPWDYVVHKNIGCTNNPLRYFFWRANGGSLANIEIECPGCNKKVTMKDVYKMKDIACTARYPENEFVKKMHSYKQPNARSAGKRCNSYAQVMQKQSSSLYMAHTYTLVSIPEYYDRLKTILQANIVRIVIGSIRGLTKDPEIIKNKLKDHNVDKDDIKQIEEYIIKNGADNFFELFDKINAKNKKFTEFIYEEFESLLKGERQEPESYFSVGPPKKYEYSESGVEFDVYPVNNIRTVTTQLGYSRVPYIREDTNPFIVDIGYKDPEKIIWYPGFKGSGEALFLTLHDRTLPSELRIRLNEYKKVIESNRPALKDWEEITKNPTFFWFHTLSHALMREISLSSGYSLPSIRERVYISKSTNDGPADNGGILIYTSALGEDGSMGGLVNMLNNSNFDECLKGTRDRIGICSNDPLCHSVRKEVKSSNGAACYGCLMLSETSCEHGNRYLDRHLVYGD